MQSVLRLVAALILAVVTSASKCDSCVGGPCSPIKGVSDHVFDRIVHFLKIAQATYAGDSCHIPSVPRLTTVYNATTDIYGWILRDDDTRELIVSFRGTHSDTNYAEDGNWTLGDITGTLPECVGCAVHGGYYLAWLSIMDQVFSRLDEQRKVYPDYRIIVTGHSLGGGLASICSAYLVGRHDELTTYTFGEVRTGNPAFASFLDQHFKTDSIETTRYFRTTHTDDGIVTAPPLSDGYQHQGLELWALDPPSPSNTYICPPEGFCAEAANGTGINAAHITYFGVGSGYCSQNV